MTKIEEKGTEFTENTVPKAPRCFQFSRGHELLFLMAKPPGRSEARLLANASRTVWAPPQACRFAHGHRALVSRALGQLLVYLTAQRNLCS